MLEKRIARDYACRALNYLTLTLLALSIVFPFYYIIVLSFNEGQNTLAGGSLMLFPRAFTLENYAEAFRYKTMTTSMLVTLSRTVIVTGAGLILQSMLAYALTFKTLPGRRWISMFFYFTTLFGGGLIPTYVLYRQMGILSTYWVLILPSLYSVWNTFILRTFFQGLPDSIAESARIDGATETRIFFSLLLPLSKPVLATVALYIGVGIWNDWFTGEYFILMRDEIQPAATMLNKLLAQSNFSAPGGASDLVPGQGSSIFANTTTTTTESLRMAFIIITIFPIMCVYPFLQKYFVKGALVGSVKG